MMVKSAQAGGAFPFHTIYQHKQKLIFVEYTCAADFSLLNLPKGKSLGRSKPATNS